MYRYFIVCLFLFSSCKSENKSSERGYTTAEKIANAHGFQHWKNVSEIQFTFNVDIDTTHFERSWKWSPKTEIVTMTTTKDTITYNRNKIEQASIAADRAFVNDKYWALFPFQFVWDDGITLSKPEKAVAPLGKTKINKITLLYGSKGGYTPGDAYDVFYDDDFIIKEWVFREGNAKEASMINTFENYKTFNGIKIAKDHKKVEGNWNLSITNIKVIIE